MAALNGGDKLLRALELEFDPGSVSHALETEGLITPALLSEILTLDTDRRRAQKLREHILNEANLHHEWYCKLLAFLSRNNGLSGLTEVLKNELSKYCKCNIKFYSSSRQGQGKVANMYIITLQV